MVAGLLAILKAGAAYVPLDPAYPADRLAFMLADSAPAIVLTHAAARPALEAAIAGLQDPPAILDLEADARSWARRSKANPDPKTLGLSSANLAYVIYTSGSTGQPKGVMVEHQGVVNLGAGARSHSAPDRPTAASCSSPRSASTSRSFELSGAVSGARAQLLARRGSS